jgi:putative flippase GtrA
VRAPAVVTRFRDHPLARHPLIRRITGYSAGSVVALIVSEAAFAIALGWGHTGTTLASACGFVGGAVPNYILNRRWAWRDRRGRNRQSEVSLYMVVSLASFLASAVCTHVAEFGARGLTPDKTSQVALVSLAYLGVSAVFFVFKFLLYETVVFKKHAGAAAEPRLRDAVAESRHGEAQLVASEFAGSTD